MDFHALQHKLFELDPVDPAEDKKRMMAAAQGGAVGDVPPTKDYVNESVEVPKGSMPLGLDSIADFAALAGVRVNEAQKHGDYARGKDPMPAAEPGRTEHPLKDKLVGEDDNTDQNPELENLIQKFIDQGMPEESARRFAQIAYMEIKPAEMPTPSFNNNSRIRPAEMPTPSFNNNSRIRPAEMPKFESIRDRLYAALKDYK